MATNESVADGGMAFPMIASGHVEAPLGAGHSNLSFSLHGGMSLRDYFAAHALNGLIASNDDDAGDRITELPGYAYRIADAMIAERAK